MRVVPLALAGLLDTSLRRLVPALALGLVTLATGLTGPLTAAQAVAVGAVCFVVVWAAEACLCSAARRTLADR
jgi:hypothetical protein